MLFKDKSHSKKGKERNEQEEKVAKLPKLDSSGIFINSCQLCVCASYTVTSNHCALGPVRKNIQATNTSNKT